MTDPQNLADRLGRLLGSEGPDIGCARCFDALDRYVELELAGREADEAVPGMRVHLEGCPACAEERDSLLELVAHDDAEGHAR